MPRKRAKPAIDRDHRLIDPGLWETFRRLTDGEVAWPLYLYGRAGRGKTLAALCLLDRVPDSLYFTAEELATAVVNREELIWRLAVDYQLVVVDELGLRDRITDLEMVAVKRIADAREHKPAIWISNHEPQAIRRLYDERIYSRICSGTWYELTGDDRRFA